VLFLLELLTDRPPSIYIPHTYEPPQVTPRSRIRKLLQSVRNNNDIYKPTQIPLTMPSLRALPTARTTRCIASSICPPSSTRRCVAHPRNIITTTTTSPSTVARAQRCPLYARSVSIPARKPTNLAACATRSFAQTASGRGNTQSTVASMAPADQIVTEAEALVRPDHLNPKEAEIWDMLDRALKPVRMDVRIPLPPCPSSHLQPTRTIHHSNANM
jgi:hypothetical protein